MTAVIAHWELPAALSDRRASKKMLSRWTHTVKAFHVDNLVFVDADGACPPINDAEINCVVVGTLDEALARFPHHERVYVEQGGIELSSFRHPKYAVYIFGSDYGQLPMMTVGIPTAIPLHADVACGIVLHDRNKPWL